MRRWVLGLVAGLVLGTAMVSAAQWGGGWGGFLPLSGGTMYGPLRWLSATGPAITAGSGTGITVGEAAVLRRTAYRVTVGHTQFTSAALTHDVTIATLPAKTRLVSIIADLTDTFACASVCTSTTLSMIVGKTAGGNQYIISFDADAAVAVLGDADAELGTSINRANAIQGGDLPSWTVATNVSARLTSGTGNLGNGTVTNLSKGTVTFYLVTEIMP